MNSSLRHCRAGAQRRDPAIHKKDICLMDARVKPARDDSGAMDLPSPKC